MQMSGFVVFFVAIVVSRIISERGYRTLDSEEKVRLMDGFSKIRSYALIPVLVLVGGYWFLMTQTSVNKQSLSVVYFGLMIVYLIVRCVVNHVKLTQLDLPNDYRRMFTIAQVVSMLGIGWFFFALFSGM